MGFEINMISGEIQEFSSARTNGLTSKETPPTQVLDEYQPLPQIQEYTETEIVINTIPESLVSVDVDAFVDQM